MDMVSLWDDDGQPRICSIKGCGRIVLSNNKLCEKCREYHRDRAQFAREKRKRGGLCLGCGKVKVVVRAYCRDCRIPRREERRVSNVDYQRRLREFTARRKMQTLEHYGSVCACCGERDIRFLTVDHINSDGAEHRRREGRNGRLSIHNWLHAHGYPPGFQILCYNCNCARSHNGGICPHKLPPIVLESSSKLR